MGFGMGFGMWDWGLGVGIGMGFGIWDGIWVGWDWDLGQMEFGILPIPLIWTASIHPVVKKNQVR